MKNSEKLFLKNTKTMSDILIIAGMHRSGTSLTANWLKENGLFIGKNLMSGKFDNIKGHFEDYEILQIHENNLKRQGIRSDGLSLSFKDKLHLDQKAKTEILTLIKSRNQINVWGWKDPRGTLFLENWKNFQNNSFFLAVYRNYYNVVDSLIRRYIHTLFNTKNITQPRRFFKKSLNFFIINMLKNKFLKSWIIYNQKILAFKQKYPDSCIIINIADLNTKSELVLSLLSKDIKWEHKNIPASSLFDEKLFNNENLSFRLNKKLTLKADVIFKSLQKHSI